jgi:two-component system response regulator YesN
MNQPRYRILIAEDEEISRLALRRICERSGCPVEVAAEVSTGRQVLEAIELARPDIILMDVVMPGMDGLAAARAVRERYPATRIVIVSAHENFEYAQQALRLGATDYLLKPVRPEQLVELLKRLCADRDGEQAQTSIETPPRQDAQEQAQEGPHAHVLKRARAYMAAHYMQSLTLEQVAEHVALAPTYFSRIFKQEMGCTFVEYLTQIRLEEAKRLLRTTGMSVTEISYAVGYQSPNYLSELFKTVEGVTASAYRRNNSS